MSWPQTLGLGAVLAEYLFTAGKVVIGTYIGRSGVASGFGAAGTLIAANTTCRQVLLRPQQRSRLPLPEQVELDAHREHLTADVKVGRIPPGTGNLIPGRRHRRRGLKRTRPGEQGEKP